MKQFFINTSLLIFIIVFLGCAKQKEEDKIYNNKKLRDAVIGYMSEPMFRNPDFVQQITGTEADLKLYDMDEQTLYFTINKKDYDSSTTLNKLTIDKNSVDFGFENNGDVFLGAYTLRGTSRFLFRFPRNDFKPDSTKSISVKLKNGFIYDISIYELADYADNISIYGGKTNSEIKADKYMANHGAFVSISNEPSLKRLCEKIITGRSSKSETAQKLLEFVTDNIEFSNKEAYGGYEVMKRPNEVLMTGKTDCSGLTILYASLLEQIGINYRLVYFPGHIAVAVEGNFSNRNHLVIKYDNVTYSLAETTVKGFQIGLTELLEKDIINEMTFIQKPGKDSKIVNVKTGENKQ